VLAGELQQSRGVSGAECVEIGEDFGG